MSEATHERVAIFDRGDLELSFRADWTAKPDTTGRHMVFKDGKDSCSVEVSVLRIGPALREVAPPIEAQLRAALAGMRVVGPDPEIRTSDRGDLWLAWCEWGYGADDSERGERRKARQRTLVASNGLFQALVTFCYWTDDAAWAVPAFERIVATMRLGDGSKLRSVRDHWSMRDPPMDGKRRRKPR